MINKIIYITSNDRSGSTVLDFLLGQHSQICSVGELHHLYSYAKEDRSIYNPSVELICSCGSKICDCPFWKKVENILDKKLEDLYLRLDLTPHLKKRINYNWLLHNPNRFLILKNKIISKGIKAGPFLLDYPSLFKSTGYHKIASDHFMLCNAISKVTSKPFIVDSSKTPHRFKYIYNLHPNKIIVVHLVRHPAAVVFSLKKRGYSLNSAISKWITTENKINKLLVDLPPKSKIFVKYEDICNATEVSLQKIASLLNIQYEHAMSILTASNQHHLGGSPSKFKYKGGIKYDDNYLSLLKAEEIEQIIKKTKMFIKKYGY